MGCGETKYISMGTDVILGLSPRFWFVLIINIRNSVIPTELTNNWRFSIGIVGQWTYKIIGNRRITRNP